MNQIPFPAPPWPGWSTSALLGRGGFGAVYEIERDNFGSVEQAAMKVITIPQNDSDIQELYADGYTVESVSERYTEHMKSIVHEYSMMARLKGCANVVYCDDVYQQRHDDGVGWDIFIRMELLTPLPKALAAEYDEAAAIRLGADLANALRVCQGQKIIHRDIKPQNIFVSTDGTCKLGDFGIAKVTERTMSGTKIGTYKYMAPEVYHDAPYGAAADVYSLGMVLYWLMNERRAPFMPLPPAIPTHEQEEQAKTRRFAGEALPEPKHGSEALKALVLRCCAYDPADRPDIKALSDDLRRLQLKQLLKQADAETVRPAAPDDEEGEPTIPPTDWTLPAERKSLQKPEKPITPDGEDREPTIPPFSPTIREDLTVGQKEMEPALEKNEPVPVQDEAAEESAPKDKPADAPILTRKDSRTSKRIGIAIGALIALLVLAIVIFSGGSEGTAPTPVQKAEETASRLYYKENTFFHIADSPSYPEMIEAMQQFEQKTGAAPFLYLIKSVYGEPVPTDEDLQRFAKARYSEFFSDDSGMLLIAYGISDSGLGYYYTLGEAVQNAVSDTQVNEAMQSCYPAGGIVDDPAAFFADVFKALCSSQK